MKRLMFAAAVVTALFVGAAAAGVKYVAVVETEVDAQSGAAAKINKAEVRQITAALRREAVNNLPRGKYTIMTSETVIAQGGAVLEECSEENCVITLGSKIGADYIVRGLISKIGANLTVTVEMYETVDGTLVASSDLASAANPAELLERAAAACGRMYKKFESEAAAVSSTQKAPPQQTPPQTAPPPTPPPPPQTAAAAPAPNYQSPAPAPAPPPAKTYQPPAPANQQPSDGGLGMYTDSKIGMKMSKTVSIGGKNAPAKTYQPPEPTYQPSGGGGFETFTDGRDGKTYRSVVIGGKKWMAENLNYQPRSGKSWCYDNNSYNCGKYGMLYDWETAKAVCSPGWHLPSRQEWDNLAGAAGGSSVAGKKLKAGISGGGTNNYGFSALPGGFRGSNGGFYDAGGNGHWWTATENGGYADHRVMYYNYGSVGGDYIDKSYGFSVRCVADK